MKQRSSGCWLAILMALVLLALGLVLLPRSEVGRTVMILAFTELRWPTHRPTVAGPEATDLLPRLTGTIELDGRAYDLPTLTKHASDSRQWTDRRWERVQRPWALSPDGHTVAYYHERERAASDAEGEALALPEDRYDLELLDTETGSFRAIPVAETDHELAWFPDNRRLAIVTWPDEQTPGPTDEGPWIRNFAVAILETRTGQVATLHRGIDPVVSTDGHQVLMTIGEQLWLVTVADGAARSVELPGRAGAVLAFWPDGTALYWALPTKGAKLPRDPQTPWHPPHPLLTVKAGVFDTSQFQTIVPYADSLQWAYWRPGE